MTFLLSQLEELARVPVLLVATDFDGTIAPIVSNPAAAKADRGSLVALRALAAMPRTHVAIISGRSLGDLVSRTREVDDAHLVGSHGSEFEGGLAAPLSPEAKALRERLSVFLRGLVVSASGLRIEEKPASLALHYRNADEHAVQPMINTVLDGPAKWLGVHVRHGKKVIELSVVKTDKGTALRHIRRLVGATAVLFLGDDTTDEDALATLVGSDLGIKIGPSESLARFRVAETTDAAHLLAHLAKRRAEWLAAAAATSGASEPQ